MLKLLNKKFIIGAAAVTFAAVAASVAVAVTYAAYRSEVMHDVTGEVAGVIAEYIRGDAVRNLNEEITYEENDGTGGVIITDLSPGDILDYSFFINGFRESENELLFNKVDLRITCEFSVLYSYPVPGADGSYIVMSESLNAVDGVYTGDSLKDVSIQLIAGYGMPSATGMVGYVATGPNDVPYYEEGGVWQFSQESTFNNSYDNYVKYTQKFGFDIPPITSSSDKNAINSFALRVAIPKERNYGDEAEDYSKQFRLGIELKMSVEQILVTDGGTTA